VKAEEREKSLALGKELLEKEFRKQHLKFNQLLKSDEMKKIFTEHSLNEPEDLYLIVGYGKLSPKYVANRFIIEEPVDKEKTGAEVKKKKTTPSTIPGISLTGIEDVMVRFAKCCDPIPGDEIYGYISRGRGVTVHTAQCPVIRSMDTDRLVDVAWNLKGDLKGKHTYPVQMRVVSIDYKGVLAEISAVISALDVNISHAEVDTTSSNQAICNFTLDVKDLKHFDKVVAEIKKLSKVLSVERLRK
jgi:GTP pyrophosphokinase